VEYFPVIDRQSALVGVVHRDDLALVDTRGKGHTMTAGELPVKQPFSVAEETAFGEVVEQFTTHDDSLVVVVRNHLPRGYITRDGFLRLIEPIHTGSFRPTRPPSQQPDYLVVPDVVEQEEAHA
jgi:predicted transcriptional regulator